MLSFASIELVRVNVAVPVIEKSGYGSFVCVRSVDKAVLSSIATQQGAAPKVGIEPLIVLKFPWSERTYEDACHTDRPAVPPLP